MAAANASVATVLSAVVGNFFVTCIKFVAFFFSGSGAMLSEGIHSAADTGNQILLFLGIKRSERASDEEFQYGYAGERFIFGILSAAGIFFIGCGVTVYHGIDSLFHPHMPELSWITFAVLGISGVIEGGVLLFAIRSVFKAKGDMPFFTYLREKAEPATLAILMEDAVAVFGLLIAAVGIILSHITQNPLFDSLGSIVVGLLLGYVAIHLVQSNRELLLGKAVPDEVEDEFLEILQSRKSIRKAHDIKSRQIAPEIYKLKAEIAINEEFLANRLGEIIPKDASLLAKNRQKILKDLARCAIVTISDEIKAIERKIQEEIPEAKHIDIEVDQNPSEPEAASSKEAASQ